MKPDRMVGEGLDPSATEVVRPDAEARWREAKVQAWQAHEVLPPRLQEPGRGYEKSSLAARSSKLVDGRRQEVPRWT